MSRLRRLAQRFSTRGKTPTDDRPLWQLSIGDEHLGDLVYASHDTPWLTCDFEPTERWAFYKPYFDWVQAMADEAAGLEGAAPVPPEPQQQTLAIKQRGGVRLTSVQSGEVWRPNIRFYEDYRYALFSLPNAAQDMP